MYGAGPAEDAIAHITSSIQALQLQLHQLQGTTGSKPRIPKPEQGGSLIRELKPILGTGQREAPRDTGKNNLRSGTSPYPPSLDDRAAATAPANYDSAIQFPKPKDADEIKPTAHPKVGDAFIQWQENTRERVRRASAHPKVAFAWILRVADPDCTYEERRNPGALAGLDCKLADALWKNLPPDSPPLRKRVKIC